MDSSADSGSRGAEGSDEVGVMRFLEQGGISGAVHAASFPSLEELTEESNSEVSGQSVPRPNSPPPPPFFFVCFVLFCFCFCLFVCFELMNTLYHESH